MSSVNKDCFTFLLLILMPFISISYLIVLSRICNTVLAGSGECRHPLLVPSIRGEDIQSFTVKFDVACRFLISD